MGGTGSGRWIYHDKKRKVEECWAIDVSDVVRAFDLRNPTRNSCILRPANPATGKTAAPMLFTLETGDDASLLRISYTVVGRWSMKHEVEDKVRLLTTEPNFGGKRWWFACPHGAEDKECGKRVGNLYRLPGGQYFACRYCLDLTYESSQRSHRYDGLWKSMSAGEREVEEMLKKFSSTIAREKRKPDLAPSRALLDAFDEAFGEPAATSSLPTPRWPA